MDIVSERRPSDAPRHHERRAGKSEPTTRQAYLRYVRRLFPSLAQQLSSRGAANDLGAKAANAAPQLKRVHV
jgi:hypothetical protein